MEIPESIKVLTTEAVGDSLNPLIKPIDLPVEDIIYAFKRSLTPKELKYFEHGLLHYKNEKLTYTGFIKALLTLLNDSIINNVKEVNIATEKKDILISSAAKNINGINTTIESFLNILPLFTDEKKVLDVKQASLIIIGYVTACLKKLYNTKD